MLAVSLQCNRRQAGNHSTNEFQYIVFKQKVVATPVVIARESWAGLDPAADPGSVALPEPHHAMWFAAFTSARPGSTSPSGCAPRPAPRRG